MLRIEIQTLDRLEGPQRHRQLQLCVPLVIIDWLSIPAAIYFLWVVRRLSTDALRNWNHGPVAVSAVDPVAPVA